MHLQIYLNNPDFPDRRNPSGIIRHVNEEVFFLFCIPVEDDNENESPVDC